MARTAAIRAPKASVVKRWVTAFALLAFFLQGLAVQSHIHAPLQPLAVKAASLPEPAPLKAPLKSQDPIDQCRLCQEMAHAGIFVAPSASAIAISLTHAAAVFAALPDFTPRSATGFGWQSRAPPRH
ncbi:MAG: hypothetical protein H0U98_02550 [Alphaproteobacteria bacterium]|nr:hypothetical protein [Alphaproteobacteria bacterium]